MTAAADIPAKPVPNPAPAPAIKQIMTFCSTMNSISPLYFYRLFLNYYAMIGCYQQTPFIRSAVVDPFQRLLGQPSIHCEAGDHFFLYGFLRIDRISGQDQIFHAAANFCTEQSVAVSRCVDKDNTSITKYIVGSSHRPNPCLLIYKRFYIGKVPSAFHIAEKVFFCPQFPLLPP